MWYDILGNTSSRDTDGNVVDCNTNPGAPDCLSSTSADGVEILNLQPATYWTSTTVERDGAWNFSTSAGWQSHWSKLSFYYPWAVRSGDVATAPAAATVLLFGLGLLGLTGMRYRQQLRQ